MNRPVDYIRPRRPRDSTAVRLVPNRLIQGPLNIWTEHSNCQIHSGGDSKTLTALLIPKFFLNFIGTYES